MAAPSFSGAGWRPAVLLSSTRQQHALQPAACRKDALTQAAHGKQQAHLDGLQQAGQRALAGEGGGDAALPQLLGKQGQVLVCLRQGEIGRTCKSPDSSEESWWPERIA